MQSFIEYVLGAKDRVSPKLKEIEGAGQKAENQLDDLQGTLSTLLGGVGIGYAVNELVEYGGELQKVNKSFEVLLGSKSGAAEMLNQVGEYAKDTNFGKMGLAQAGKDLLSYGVASEKVVPTLKMLGDIALGDEEKLGRLSYAYAQTQAAGRLMGQDLLQMINAGFNPLQQISEDSGLSMGYLRDQMSEGAISAEMVAQAFEAATAEGGRFHNGAAALAEDGIGRFDRMAETWTERTATLGSDLLNGLSPVWDGITGVLDFVGANSEVFTPLIAGAGTLVVGLYGIVAAGNAWAEVQKLITVLAELNPWGIAIVGIMTLITTLTVAYHKFDKFREVVDGTWGVLRQFGGNVGEWVTNPMDKLKTLLGNVIAPFMEALAMVKEGDFFGAAKALGKGLVGMSPVGLMANAGLFDGLGDAYKDAAEESRKKSEAKKAAEGSETEKKTPDGPTERGKEWLSLLGSGDNDLNSGIGEITSRGPKEFNIRIKKLTGIEKLTTNQIGEALSSVEDQLKRLLLNTLNDAQAATV